MQPFPFTMVGFDLDGTLVESHRDLALAINHALEKAGRPPVEPEVVRDLIGGGTARMLERALERTGGQLPAEEFEQRLGDLLAWYETHIADKTVPYEGCLAALDALAERGCTLAVVTNKIENFAVKLLKELGMADRFAVILGGDTLGPGRAKPAPDMIDEAIRRCREAGAAEGRFAMIGDSSYDVRAAQAAGVPSVALSFGYNDLPADQLGADVVIGHFDELIPALERL
jgi:phosphoglycolate phosphatase